MSNEAHILEITEKLRADADAPVILDFDQTLFLDNSTERFLDAARPRILAFLLVACCDWLLYAFAGLGLCNYNRQRDFWRVWCCTVLLPWTWPRWRCIAPAVGRRLMNDSLIDAVPPGQRVIVLSYGFQHIIAPLLEGMELQHATLICSRMWPRLENLRSRGKRDALARTLPVTSWSRALFVTDSEDDADVVEAIPSSYVVQWGPAFQPAFQGLYVPLRYTVEGKYPHSRYFTCQIVLEDFALLLLAYACAWRHGVALWGLLLSLYTIYEIGHHDNDHRAVARETAPAVSREAAAFPTHPRCKPWIYAMAFALAGLLVLRPELWRHPGALVPVLARDMGLWLAVLLALHGVFLVFNRCAPMRRILLFPMLHLFKTFPFVLFLSLPPVGTALLASQVLSISINYGLYRHGGDVDRFNRQLWRMICFFAMIGVLAAVAPGVIGRDTWFRVTLIAVWGGIRALERAKRMNILRILAGTVRGRAHNP